MEAAAQPLESQGRPFSWASDGVVLLITLSLPTVSTWLYFVVFAGQGELPKLLYGGSKLVQLVLPFAWMWFRQRQEIGWPRLCRRSLAWGLLFGLFTLGGMLWLGGQLRSFFEAAGMKEALEAKLTDFGITTLGRYLGMAVFLCVLHSAFEEYYWRWFVFGQLRRGMPWGWAVAVSSLGFMAHHILVLDAYLPVAKYPVANLGLSSCIALGGAVWAIIYQKTGSLLGPWIAHLSADAGLMVIGYQLVGGMLK